MSRQVISKEERLYGVVGERRVRVQIAPWEDKNEKKIKIGEEGR